MSHNFGDGNCQGACIACGVKREWAHPPCPAAAASVASSSSIMIQIPDDSTSSFRANHEAAASAVKAIPPPSAEQQAIIDAVKRGASLIINSVAGSGKTTTACHIAHALPGCSILLLTYNARLKLETRLRALKLKLENFEIHTYHSLGYRYYLGAKCKNDKGLMEIIQRNVPPKQRIPDFDVVIIDEAQDMTLLFYAFVRKFLRDHVNPVQLLVIGDECQAVYEFNGADSRFLTLADEMFANCQQIRDDGKFERLSLRTSYRITTQTARFVSRSLKRCSHSDEQYIVANKNGLAVNYYIGSPWIAAETIAARLIKDMTLGKYRADDVFVLANTVAKATPKSPLRRFERLLVDAQVPCFVARNDESRVHEDTMRGKVTFVTMNQSKGLERKVVIVVGFDNSYFEYFGRGDDRSTCPSKFYVAATRAEQHLHLIAESATGDEFSFMDRALLDRWQDGSDATSVLYPSPVKIIRCGYFSETPKVKKLQKEAIKKEGVVTDLIRFLPDYIMDDAMLRVQPVQIAKPGVAIQLPLEIVEGELTEDVSAINGLAVPAMLEAIDRVNMLDQVSDLPASQSALGNGDESTSEATTGDEAISGDQVPSAAASAGVLPARPVKDVSEYVHGKRIRLHSNVNSNDESDSDSDSEAPPMQVFTVAVASSASASSSASISSSSATPPSSAPSSSAVRSPLSSPVRRASAAAASSSLPAAPVPRASKQTHSLCSMHDIVHRASRGEFSDDGSGLDPDLQAHLDLIDREIAESRAQQHVYPQPCTFLRLATLYHAVLTNYKHKTSQLKRFDWLSNETALACLSNLKTCIPQPKEAHFERELEYRFMQVGASPPTEIVIRGQLDAYVAATNTVWEFKCTSEITIEHKMQLIMYAWLWLKDAERTLALKAVAAATVQLPVFKIFNILTGELWEARPTPHDLEHIAKQVIDNANKLSVRLPTDELLAFVTQAAAPGAPISAIKARFDAARKR